MLIDLSLMNRLTKKLSHLFLYTCQPRNQLLIPNPIAFHFGPNRDPDKKSQSGTTPRCHLVRSLSTEAVKSRSAQPRTTPEQDPGLAEPRGNQTNLDRDPEIGI